MSYGLLVAQRKNICSIIIHISGGDIMNVISLFGCGGLDLGFEKGRFNIPIT